MPVKQVGGIAILPNDVGYSHIAATAFFRRSASTMLLITSSRSGFKAKAPMGSQLRVWRNHREGF